MNCLFHLLGAILVSVSTYSMASAQPGFEHGNQFEFQDAVGQVSVHCPSAPVGYPNSAHHTCYGYAFSKPVTARFRGPLVDADEVELFATRANASTRVKSSAYDGHNGVSTDRFNLWIETLTQKPLLDLGHTNVQWTLKKRGQFVQTGFFIAEVTRLQDLQCPYISATSWDPYDCISSSRVCQDYYRQYGNQCR